MRPLSNLQRDILTVIRSDDGMSVREVALAVGLTITHSVRTSVGRSLNRLCSRGLVVRREPEVTTRGKARLYLRARRSAA